MVFTSYNLDPIIPCGACTPSDCLDLAWCLRIIFNDSLQFPGPIKTSPPIYLVSKPCFPQSPMVFSSYKPFSMLSTVLTHHFSTSAWCPHTMYSILDIFARCSRTILSYLIQFSGRIMCASRHRAHAPYLILISYGVLVP